MTRQILLSKAQNLLTQYPLVTSVSGQSDQDEAVVRGHVDHNHHSEGLSSHAGCTTELIDSRCLMELPACLSFNIVMAGKADFSIGKYHYSIGGNIQDGPECSAIILAEPNTIVRHLKKNATTEKINVFVERSWLESRAKSDEDQQRLKTIFSENNALRYWKPSEKTLLLVNTFIQANQVSDFEQNLLKEALAIQLLSHCLEEMDLLSQLAEPVSEDANYHFSRCNALKQHVDKMLSNQSSLEAIADSWGCSVSTLQRSFKSHYGLTVIQYCRQRRLELAKRALMIDNVSIGEAAYMAGYSHPSNFITAFRKRYSLTPAELIRTRSMNPLSP